MKKIVVALLLSLVVLTGCGNQTIIDTKWTFNEAVVNIAGEYETIKIKRWSDYDGGTVQIITTDGRVILTHYTNVVLIGY